MRVRVAVVTCLLVFGLVPTAMADIVTLEFTARLDRVDSSARGVFTIGDAATIRYSFETTTGVESGVTSTTASYLAIRSLELTVQLARGGTYTARSTRGVISVSNNLAAYETTVDHYFAGATNQRPTFDLVAPAIAGYTVTGVYLSLWDTSATAFTSLALPRAVDPARFVPNATVPREGVSLRFDRPGGPGYVSASLTPPSGSLDPPTNLGAVVNGSTVALTWTPPAGEVTGYRLEAGTSSGFANVASVVLGPTPSFVAPSVPSGVYYVKVRAIGAGGDSPPSNEVTISVIGVGCAMAPGPPTALTATVNGLVVALTFQQGSGCSPTQYLLRVGSGPGLSDIAIVNLGGMRSLTASASPGTYFARVIAQNAFGSSAPSNEVIIRVD
jgi:hypothetical protein